jgi:rod shape-determining protein MreC
MPPAFPVYPRCCFNRKIQKDPVGVIFLELLRPFQSLSQATVFKFRSIQQTYITWLNLFSENQRLKETVQELAAERQRLMEAEVTNQRLRELLELKSQLALTSTAAAVIGTSASSWFRSLTINKGSQNGIEKGMAVISPQGIVGRIITVSPRSSKVLLTSDHYSGVDVLVQRNRARGIVSGSLSYGPIMKYVKRSDDIQVGDQLITSGLDGVYPKGIFVGNIVRVEKQPHGLFQHVEVELAVDPSRIEDVLVVSTGNLQ